MVLFLGMERRVEEIVKSRLPDIKGHENMEVKVCGLHCGIILLLSFFVCLFSISENYAHTIF